MYDKNEPFQILDEALSFVVNISKFELWESGEKVKEGEIEGRLQFLPLSNNKSKTEVTCTNFPSDLNIKELLYFDLTYTGNDRVFLATVPDKTNINDYNNFQVFKQMVPPGFPIITVDELNFEENVPYVCSVFAKKNKIAKISFLFGNNPRTLNLYIIENKLKDNQYRMTGMNIAIKLMENLILEWEDGDAWIDESLFISATQSEFPATTINSSKIQEIIIFINSIIPNDEIIRRNQQEYFGRKSWTLMTYYNKSDLTQIMNKIIETKNKY